MSALITQFLAARRCGTPIVAIQTADPAATMAAVCEAVPQTFPHGSGKSAIQRAVCKIEWDFVRGFTGRNSESRDVVKEVVGEFDDSKANPPMALVIAARFPSETLLFVHLANRWSSEPAWVQACWLLRDGFKVDRRMLVLLGPSISLPAELSGDVIVLDEPLPNGDQLRAIVAEQFEAAAEDDEFCKATGWEDRAAEQLPRAVKALQGLPAFQAEQVTAMALRRDGLDLDALWESKRKQIEQTPGLRVWRGQDSFAAIGGCATIKGFLSKIMHGKSAPSAIVFIDEIEKAMGGTKGDSSGTSLDQLGVILSYMQDNAATGVIFVGAAGVAKSAIAKAAGAEIGIPTIQLDLGACKSKWIGDSEGQIRNALKVVTATSNGKSLWIATCNGIADLPPELRRRFTLGTFFFDLPDRSERLAIWAIWTTHYQLPQSDLPRDDGWTGAEIRQCCDLAWRLGCSLTEAAAFVVPISKSAPDALERLRSGSEGRFLSASYPGVYTRENPAESKPEKTRRKLELAE